MQRAIRDVDLRLLRVFKTVVECGGFSAAETELNIQRSTISTHMADLETRLGCRLCRRGRAGFALTESGRTVYDATIRLFASIDQFAEHVGSAAGQLSGHVDIGVVDNTVTDPGAGIIDALRNIKEKAPMLQLHLHVASPTEIERELLDGRLHVGIAPRMHPLPGLEYVSLYRERNALYCGRAHGLFADASGDESLERVLASDYVARGYEGGVEVSARHLPFKVKGTARSMEGAATLILTGAYIGYLPEHYARYWVERGEMRHIGPADTAFDIEFCILTRRGAQPSRSAASFIDSLGAFHRKRRAAGVLERTRPGRRSTIRTGA